jgi:hypothetical protein
MSSRPHLHGGNLMLASALAVLSYVPFDWVAKGTIVLSVFLFIVDPFPPLSRLVSLVATLVVAVISRMHRHWLEENDQKGGKEDEAKEEAGEKEKEE